MTPAHEAEESDTPRADVQSANWREFQPLGLDPILEHALEAFSENGFHGTTVRDLARRVRAGQSPEADLLVATAAVREATNGEQLIGVARA